MKDIIFFSNNEHKIFEVSQILSKNSFNILGLNKFKKIRSPRETGKNFEENAKIKSVYGFKKFNKVCFADDSGICISALNGKPGIASKKFLIDEGGRKTALNRIIEIAKKKNNFKAFFQTTICISISLNENYFFTGKLMGNISSKIKGKEGFGYDPIFIPEGQKQTLGEITNKEKSLISHRYLALKKLLIFLENLV